jgi:hypothetical protein
MSDLTDPLKDSYIGKVADAMQPYVDDLKAKQFDPTSRIEQLSGAGKLIESAIKLRKQAEGNATSAVANEQGVRGQFYDLATATVSLVEGLLGKAHPLTVKLRGLRSDLTGGASAGPASPPPPPA